jgi:hypothetical protein
MEQAALRIMEAIGVQVLVIDEVHNSWSLTDRPLSLQEQPDKQRHDQRG